MRNETFPRLHFISCETFKSFRAFRDLVGKYDVKTSTNSSLAEKSDSGQENGSAAGIAAIISY